MSAPRPVFPGRFLLVTRRCTQRQFLLRPDTATNNAFIYCLGEAAQRFGLVVVLSVMMSNHHHTVLYDPHGLQTEFREHFHRMMAQSQNALRGRWENLWSSEEPSVVELVSREALLDKLVYVATNPVKHGLVERAHHWPGPNFISPLMTGKRIRAYRPHHFFSEDGSMPLEVELEVKLPDDFENADGFVAELARKITETEDGFARERQQTGRGVLGRKRVLRQSWRDCPEGFEPRRGLRPRVATRNKWLRIAALQRNKTWESEYREARTNWLAGLPAEFPYGTYWLRRFANVRVKPPPQAA